MFTHAVTGFTGIFQVVVSATRDFHIYSNLKNEAIGKHINPWHRRSNVVFRKTRLFGLALNSNTCKTILVQVLETILWQRINGTHMQITTWIILSDCNIRQKPLHYYRTGYIGMHVRLQQSIFTSLILLSYQQQSLGIFSFS